jgi:iron complex outermembrane receptor protein
MLFFSILGEHCMTLIRKRALLSAPIMAAVALALTTSPVKAADTVAASAETDNGTPLQEVIVTGTRQSGLSAAESPAPIQILSADALKAAAAIRT